MSSDPTADAHDEAAVDVTAPDSVGRWFARLAKGAAVGVGAILPGLSGGVLAVIFKLYDPMIRFLANIKRNFVSNVLFFIPVGIGMLVDRSGGKASFGDVPCTALLHMDVQTYKPEECPLCKKGVPMTKRGRTGK